METIAGIGYAIGNILGGGLTTTGLSAVATGGAAAASLTSTLMKPKMPELPAEGKKDTRIQEAAYAEMTNLRRTGGLRSTIMTGPLGITQQATTYKTQLGV